MDINSLLKSQMVSTLLGVIVGGLITFAVSTYNIKKQFTNQEILNNKARVEEKRKALVTIREEMFRNGAINSKAIEIMDNGEETKDGIKMPIGWIEFECSEWNAYKSIFLLATIDENELITKISWLYYQFTVCNVTRILTKETAIQIKETIYEVVEKVNNLINALNIA